MTVLAELTLRHTRRHMPTRRVAVEGAFLPTREPGHGLALVHALVADVAGTLDDETREMVPRVLDLARRGELSVPRIALRHRLQTDTHGLDRSRHRVVSSGVGDPWIEIDAHGPTLPQLLGVFLSSQHLPPAARRMVVGAAADGLRTPGEIPGGYRLRWLAHGDAVTPPRPPPPGSGHASVRSDGWSEVPPECAWALGVLGFGEPAVPHPREVSQRFRTLLRNAHPDHGGHASTAAERIAELTEARSVLLGWVSGRRETSATEGGHV